MNNVMKRPMFMQAGGSVDPALQQAQQAEQAMASQAAPMGAAFADQMNMKLDNAETFKDVIDGMRGNEMPLEARYDELAGLVGEQDAMATPESVLALVQPTMMMTEQGAANSGVAQLMEQVVASTGVEDQTMDQGLGSLMAAGQGPVQNFNQGGPVRKYAPGGPVIGNIQGPTFTNLPTLPGAEDFKQAYEDRLGVYQQALGIDPAKRKKDLQSDILFDISKAALAFGSGVDPTTGENMADKPLASQLMRAAQPLPGNIQERLAAQRQEDQGIKLGALQSAEDFMKAQAEQIGKERTTAMDLGSRMAMQTADMDFRKDENMSAREHETKLTNLKGMIEERLTKLRGLEDREAINLRGVLQQDLARLNSELTGTRDQALHEMNLETLGVKSEYDIAKMDKDFEQRSALQATQLASTAEQNALDRTLRLTMQDKDLGVKQAMQQAQLENSRELQAREQEFKSIESGKDRALRIDIQTRMEKQAQLDRDLKIAIQENDIEAQQALQAERLENAEALQNARIEFQKADSAEERALRSDIIDRQIQQQVFDRLQQAEQFKTTADLERYGLTIKQQQAKYTQLGNSIDARMTSVLIDPDLQAKYANGSATPAERQLFEQSALSLSSPKSGWDEAAGRYVVKPGTKLAPDVMRALQANPEVFEMIQKNLGVSGKGEDQSVTEDQLAQAYPVRTELGLPMPPAGMDIPELNPEALPKNNLDYSAAFGVSGAIDNIANTLSDFFGGELFTPETEDVRNYFGALNTKIIGLTDDMFEGRPSNFQIEITSQLLPDYGAITNGDETAVRQLLKLKEYIKQELAKKSDALNMGAMSADQKASARREFQNISYLLAEMETVSRAMSAATTEDRPSVESFIK